MGKLKADNKEAGYGDLVKAISAAHEQTQRQATQAVNVALTLRNWLIGYHIFEYEQNGQDRAAYGEKLLENLAKDLTEKLGRGFGWRNLFAFRGFYLSYPILQSLIAKFSQALQISSSVEMKRLDLHVDCGGFLVSKSKVADVVDYITGKERFNRRYATVLF